MWICDRGLAFGACRLPNDAGLDLQGARTAKPRRSRPRCASSGASCARRSPAPTSRRRFYGADRSTGFADSHPRSHYVCGGDNADNVGEMGEPLRFVGASALRGYQSARYRSGDVSGQSPVRPAFPCGDCMGRIRSQGAAHRVGRAACAHRGDTDSEMAARRRGVARTRASMASTASSSASRWQLSWRLGRYSGCM